MHSIDIRRMMQHPLVRVGIVLQSVSAFFIGVILLSIHLEWLDIISIGLESGIEHRSLKLGVLYWGLAGLGLAFVSGFALYGLASHRLTSAQPGPPTDGPMAQLNDSKVSGGPPSVN